jgi:hypothetical protein
MQRLHFDWRYDERWYVDVDVRRRSLTGGKLAAIPNGVPGLVAIPPFLGTKAGPPGAESESSEAKLKAGSEALWAAVSANWSQGGFRSDFELLSFNKESVERGTFGTILRVYPGILKESEGTGQVFRELLKFTSPPPFDRLRWLSFRFLGDDEDIVWIFSPAIGQARQLTGSNRSDRLFPRSISADDLLGWSGKPERTIPEYDRSIVALVPFPSHLLTEASSEPNGCFAVENGVGTAEPRFNLDAQRFSTSAPWLPTRWVWTPRTLHRIVLTSNDPYALHGRQVVYLDDQSLLPVVRVVYSRAGRYLRTLISSFGLAQSPKGDRKFWYPATTLIEDDETGQFLAVDYRKTQVCDRLVPELQSPEFDPRKLGQPPEVPGVASSPASSTAVPLLTPAAEELPND